jgi:hypothetical protein
MRVARGLWRIWIIGSATWIAFVTFDAIRVGIGFTHLSAPYASMRRLPVALRITATACPEAIVSDWRASKHTRGAGAAAGVRLHAVLGRTLNPAFWNWARACAHRR